MALFTGGAAGLVLSLFCSLAGLVQLYAKICCGRLSKFTPNGGCLSGFVTGFATIGYTALWMIEVPFTFNNPISDH
ncbi:hypothetical protein niasHS_011783 [Heterodera schachtii]|uniref:Uncharacterized protein n=1 Tax=Heterodera schachtii TaxID=97005 RepID=A0ABD2I7F7_HETSC